MSGHRPTKPKKRDERHSAAWGRRSMLVGLLLLASKLGLGQATTPVQVDGHTVGVHWKLAPELATRVARWKVGAEGDGQTRVIVQFNQAPTEEHFSRLQTRGARLNGRLGLVRAGAYTLPASHLEDMANDPAVASISPDHDLKAADDFTDAAIGVSAARNLGLGTWGMGIGVAVIDSGVDGPDVNPQVVYSQTCLLYTSPSPRD